MGTITCGPTYNLFYCYIFMGMCYVIQSPGKVRVNLVDNCCYHFYCFLSASVYIYIFFLKIPLCN